MYIHMGGIIDKSIIYMYKFRSIQYKRNRGKIVMGNLWLQELKDLRSQLHHAADYCEASFLNAKQKQE